MCLICFVDALISFALTGKEIIFLLNIRGPCNAGPNFAVFFDG